MSDLDSRLYRNTATRVADPLDRVTAIVMAGQHDLENTHQKLRIYTEGHKQRLRASDAKEKDNINALQQLRQLNTASDADDSQKRRDISEARDALGQAVCAAFDLPLACFEPAMLARFRDFVKSPALHDRDAGARPTRQSAKEKLVALFPDTLAEDYSYTAEQAMRALDQEELEIGQSQAQSDADLRTIQGELISAKATAADGLRHQEQLESELQDLTIDRGRLLMVLDELKAEQQETFKLHQEKADLICERDMAAEAVTELQNQLAEARAATGVQPTPRGIRPYHVVNWHRHRLQIFQWSPPSRTAPASQLIAWSDPDHGILSTFEPLKIQYINHGLWRLSIADAVEFDYWQGWPGDQEFDDWMRLYYGEAMEVHQARTSFNAWEDKLVTLLAVPRDR